MPFHIFRHIKTDQLYPHRHGKLFSDFCFANPCWARKEIGPNRFFRLAQPCAGKLYRSSKLINRFILAKDNTAQFFAKLLQTISIRFRDRARRDPCHLRNDLFDLCDINYFFALILCKQHLTGTGFINDIDSLIGKLAIRHIFS